MSPAIARAALARPEHTSTLLSEIDTTPESRNNSNYTPLLPALVRAALTTNNPQLADQPTTGVEPHTPYAEHALTTAAAALAEADGDTTPPSTGTPTPRNDGKPSA